MTDLTHGDLSEDVELLQHNLDKAREEIARLRQLRTRGKTPLKITGPGDAPTRAYAGDAGFDLYVAPGPEAGGSWHIYAGEFVDIDVGVAVELPPDTWAMITGRSSTLRQRGLLVAQGIIDNGYRGQLYAGVRNLNDEVVIVRPGERIAQLIPFPLTAANMEVIRVEELADSERGTQGFGSSGK